ncbi:MAG: hypothetical protein H8D35_03400 [Nitrosopumilus sp.]|nr:hypothetical protein [Nitrosopumilus sp.]MBL7015015.1 hypothetical protein [Nitrosopumilus sp.]
MYLDRLGINQAEQKILLSILKVKVKNDLEHITQFTMSGKKKGIKIRKDEIIPDATFDKYISKLEKKGLVVKHIETKKVWKKKKHRPKYPYTVSDFGHYLLLESSGRKFWELIKSKPTKSNTKERVKVEKEFYGLFGHMTNFPKIIPILKMYDSEITPMILLNSVSQIQIMYDNYLIADDRIDIVENTFLEFNNRRILLERRYALASEEVMKENIRLRETVHEEWKQYGKDLGTYRYYEEITSVWDRLIALIILNFLRFPYDQQLNGDWYRGDLTTHEDVGKRDPKLILLELEQKTNKKLETLILMNNKKIIGMVKADSKLHLHIKEILKESNSMHETISFFKKILG